VTLSETILEYATLVALGVLCLSFAITVWRVIVGPTLPDRILALDMLVAVAIGFIAVIAVKTGFTLYVDIAIALGLVGFLATIAFARFVLDGSYKSANGKAVKANKNVG
jgi:multicomponent Na+:H+ antiporter subunit F